MTKRILACLCLVALAAPAWALCEFTYVPVNTVEIGTDFEQLHMLGILTNTGDEGATFTITKDEVLPEFWSASICIGDFCYAPFVNEVTEVISAGDSREVWAYLNLFNEPGTGFVTIEVSPSCDPGQRESIVFTGMHEGGSFLLVDGGDNPGPESPIYTAFMNADRACCFPCWPTKWAAPSLEDLQRFPSVIWVTDDARPSLTEEHRIALGGYLDAGGRVCLSGQDLVEDFADEASPNYDPAAAAWFHGYSGLLYGGDVTSLDVVGETGDQVGEGQAFLLGGSETTPDYFVVDEGALGVSFRYGGPDTGKVAGAVKGGLFTYGFGLHNIDQIYLGGILANLIDALGAQVGVEEGQTPAGLELVGNFPNPFNPKTTLIFRAASAGTARLEVQDARGRVISSLLVPVAAGENRIPFTAQAADGTDLPSGVYFYRVAMGAEAVGGKMTVIK